MAQKIISAKPATHSTILVILAFAIVYIVWGSTYYFIRLALTGFPPFLLGATRFLLAGIIMLVWGLARGEKMFDSKLISRAAVSGILMLFVGNGIVIWVEQTVPSALAAIMLSTGPLWFVILDRPRWSEQFRNKRTLGALLLGFAGVILLFGTQIGMGMNSVRGKQELLGLFLLNVGVIGWTAGSLYSKRSTTGSSAIANTTWQVLAAGFAFIPGMLLLNETGNFELGQVSLTAWIALAYLVVMGSIVAYSAYIWLLQIRPATQVSTHAYVNPVVAVLLGVFVGNEQISFIPVVGLAIILLSVLLIQIKPKS